MRRFSYLLLILIPLAAGGLFLDGCARTPEQRYARALEKGKKFLKDNSAGRATVEFQNAVQAKPDAGEGYYWLSVAQLSANNAQGAIQTLLKGTQADPNYAPAQVKLSELMILTQNEELSKDAEKRLIKVITENRQDENALYALAASEVRLGNARDAERYLQQILQKSPHNLRSAIALAEMKAAQKDFTSAEQILKALLEKMPNSAEATAALGGLYVGMDRGAEGKTMMEKAVRLDPKNSVSLMALGSVQLTLGDVAAAEATFKRIAAL